MTMKKENPDWPEVESTLLPIDGVALSPPENLMALLREIFDRSAIVKKRGGAPCVFGRVTLKKKSFPLWGGVGNSSWRVRRNLCRH